jgi:alkanesulfonate monooxygenase SsuD/methylene tetrahydromethanopterin reductase-like flavin-dependent oxidoreductase (luciferase family)
VGDPETVAAKILHWRKILGIERFMLHTSAGNLPHQETMRSIELLGTKVSQRVRGR